MPVTVSEKGWVVIPADLRKKYNLHPGAKVTVVDYGGAFALINLGEALYITERERGLVEARRTLGAVDQLPLEIVALSPQGFRNRTFTRLMIARKNLVLASELCMRGICEHRRKPPCPRAAGR